MTQKYLFVGGPLHGQVIEHDGGPVVAEPSTFKLERVGQAEFADDVVTFRVSHSVAFYYHRNINLGGSWLRVMSTHGAPTEAGVAGALAKALGLTLWAAPKQDGTP